MPIKPDPATPVGEAIIDLANLMDALQECSREWPGADTVSILARWLNRFSFTVEKDLTPQRVGRAWVLRQWDRHEDAVTLWYDRASALAAVAQQVRGAWDDVAGTDGVPYLPPADDQMAVDLYYGPERNHGDSGYALYPADISRHLRGPISLSLSDSSACAEVNSSALFHPQASPDDEGLPCIEIAGILVFVYLDADREAVRVSIHLDTTDERLIRADGAVPLRVEIEDATVFDNRTPSPAPAHPTGGKARSWRLARRIAPSRRWKCR
ncbi:hypothetical protein [Streptomyces sp. PA5.6]|uniref:hypothetical protein n=1 Tax=Streptomyces sp. PA5.6 TaxID=3035651 RepID=UPI003904C513